MKLWKNSDNFILLMVIFLITSCVGNPIPNNKDKLSYFSTENGIYIIDFYIPGARFYPVSRDGDMKPRDFKLPRHTYYDQAITYRDSLFLPYDRGVMKLTGSDITCYPSGITAVFDYQFGDGMLIGHVAYIRNDDLPFGTVYLSQPIVHIVIPDAGFNNIVYLDSEPLSFTYINRKIAIVTSASIYIITVEENNDFHGVMLPLPFGNDTPLKPVDIYGDGRLVAMGWKGDTNIIFADLSGSKPYFTTTKLPAPVEMMLSCNGELVVATTDRNLYVIDYQSGRYEKKTILVSSPLNMACFSSTVFVDTRYDIYAYSITSGTKLSDAYCFGKCYPVRTTEGIFFVGEKYIVSYDGSFHSMEVSDTILATNPMGDSLYYITSSRIGFISASGQTGSTPIDFYFRKILIPSPEGSAFWLLTDSSNGSFVEIGTDLSTRNYDDLLNKNILGE